MGQFSQLGNGAVQTLLMGKSHKEEASGFHSTTPMAQEALGSTTIALTTCIRPTVTSCILTPGCSAKAVH